MIYKTRQYTLVSSAVRAASVAMVELLGGLFGRVWQATAYSFSTWKHTSARCVEEGV